MELLFKQTAETDGGGMFSDGIRQCFFKRLLPRRDDGQIIKKSHRHAGFEIHIIEKGYQIYEVEGETVRMDAGQYLIISPSAVHRVVDGNEDTCKYGITFSPAPRGEGEGVFALENAFAVGTVPGEVWDGIGLICRERAHPGKYSHRLIAGRVAECICFLFRPFASISASAGVPEGEDPRFSMAVQYLQDNICSAPTVSDVAAYCYLGTKQLTRIFQAEAGCTVAEYIRRKRGEHIEKLLADPALSLCEISERMHFNDEYYFNAFFKKYAGISPGAYRKSVLKKYRSSKEETDPAPENGTGFSAIGDSTPPTGAYFR